MPTVTIKLTVGSFSVEVSGDEKFANKKFEELVGRFFLSRSSATIETSASAGMRESAGKKRTSAAEFLKKTAAKSQYDRALVLGYYLEKSGTDSFTSSELDRLGREAKQPFTNASDAVAKLTARGLMMSAGEKESQRAHALTASGETYVEGLLEASA